MAHIQDRRKQGKGWIARYIGPDEQEHTKSFRLKSDAEKFLENEISKMNRNEWTDPAAARTLVSDYYETWRRRQPWRISSRATAESAFDVHIIPAFGSRAIGSLRRGEIEGWANSLELAGPTARVVLGRLGSLLESAVDDGLIGRNPARRTRKPLVDEPPVVPLTSAELDRLTRAAPPSFCIALTLGAAVGLRQGEACGLTADRINFLRRELVVDRQLLTPPNGEPFFAPPKTKRGYRTIPLADVALEALASHVERFGTGTDGLLLHEDGDRIRRQRFGRIWRKLRKSAGLPTARFHDTRHTFASTLLSGNVSVAAAAEYLGDTPTTLLKTYAHLIPADHDRARSVVQAAFSRSDGTETGPQRDAATS
jgi:integrase